MNGTVVTVMTNFIHIFEDKLDVENEFRALITFLDSCGLGSTYDGTIGVLVLIKNVQKIINEGDNVLLFAPWCPLLNFLNIIIPNINITWTPPNDHKNFTQLEEKFPLKNCKKINLIDDNLELQTGYKLIMGRTFPKLPTGVMSSILTKDGTLLLQLNSCTLEQWRVSENGNLEEIEYNLNTYNYNKDKWLFAFLKLTQNEWYYMDLYLIKLQKNNKCSVKLPAASAETPSRAAIINSTRDDVLKVLEAESECPVCLLFLKVPIYTCSNGHSFCEPCLCSFKTCPICLTEVFIRNLPLEKILKVLPQPCKGEKHGCKQVYFEDVLKIHEKNCKYLKLIPCNFTDCNLEIVSTNFCEHVQAHEIPVVEPLAHSMKIITKDIKNLKEHHFIKSPNSSDIFEIFAETCENHVKYQVKLIGPVKHKLDYLVKAFVDVGSDCLEFSGYPQVYDEPENPIVEIPENNIKNFELICVSCTIQKSL